MNARERNSRPGQETPQDAQKSTGGNTLDKHRQHAPVEINPRKSSIHHTGERAHAENPKMFPSLLQESLGNPSRHKPTSRLLQTRSEAPLHTLPQTVQEQAEQTDLRERERTVRNSATWRPAREERETAFFLSLSLSLAAAAAVVFPPASKPFAPFPDISLCCLLFLFLAISNFRQETK